MLGCSVYYFSTHGWLFVESFGGGALEDEAAFAAFAAARALLSKKFAIASWSGLRLGG